MSNYSYEAIEEFLSNAIYHRSYQIYEPVTVRIERDRIEISSAPGPDRSISDHDIKHYHMRARRYRNRRIGDFLKELHLVEDRNTGIPTSLKSIRANGSPLPLFLTDEDRTFFSVILPIHEAFTDTDRTDFELSEHKTEANEQKKVKRRSRDEIKKAILDSLQYESKATNIIYKELGYSGSPSKVFREVIEELVDENEVEFVNKEQKHDSKNRLKLNQNKENLKRSSLF